MQMSNLLPPTEATALLKRFRVVERWLEKRNIDRPESFMMGADPTLDDDEARRMAYVRRTKQPRMYDTDEQWISKCEGVLSQLAA